MFRRIWSLALKELIQLGRDRLMLTFILLFPVAQLVLLAQATGRGIHDLSLAVVDQDRSAYSRGLIQALDNVPELAWRTQLSDPDELSGLIQTGQATVGVVIPAGFGAALEQAIDGQPAAGRSSPVVQVMVDGSNNVVGGTARSAVDGVVADYAARLATARGAPAAAPVELHTTARYNPGLNSRLFTIPAQMGFIVYQVTLAVASLVFARERELGTLEQLLVMPLRRVELILGKGILTWLVGGLDFVLMYWVVVRFFGIPMRGEFAVLLAFSLAFVAVEIGYGVIISSFARTQQQAILYVFMLAMLDMAFSGYLVPVKNMPALFQLVAEISPLQHYLVVVRAIMLKGAGLAILWPHFAALVGIGGGIGVLAWATATRSLE